MLSREADVNTRSKSQCANNGRDQPHCLHIAAVKIAQHSE